MQRTSLRKVALVMHSLHLHQALLTGVWQSSSIMIKYRAKTLRCLYTDPKWLLTILEMYCFRQAFLIAFCGAILAGGLWLCDKFFLFRLEDISDVFDPAAYTAFVWFLSTLIVFRTSHSYNSFFGNKRVGSTNKFEPSSTEQREAPSSFVSQTVSGKVRRWSIR